mgnify:CR=1 FL=1
MKILLVGGSGFLGAWVARFLNINQCLARIFDPNKPDGTPRKFISSKLINSLGWHHQVSLKDGLLRTYENFIKDDGNF